MSAPTTTRAATRRHFVVTTALAGLGLAGAACATAGPGSGNAAGRPGPTAVPRADHEVELHIEERAGAPPGTTPEFFFEPVGLAIRPGQTVRFKALTPHHTVTAYHTQHVKPLRVPEGVPPFSSPVLPVGESFLHTFTQPGVYDLWCGPHEYLGMVMRLVVGTATGPGATPPTDDSPLGTAFTAKTVLSDPALAPARILERGRVSWKELDPASKRLPPFLEMP